MNDASNSFISNPLGGNIPDAPPPAVSISRRVTYVPPDPRVIKEYAREVCAEFGQRDPAYQHPEVVSSFAAFLTVVSENMAKCLNEGHEELLLNRDLKKWNTDQEIEYGSKKINI